MGVKGEQSTVNGSMSLAVRECRPLHGLPFTVYAAKQRDASL